MPLCIASNMIKISTISYQEEYKNNLNLIIGNVVSILDVSI